jgi:ATP-dependent helicase YprA (DUF1998 family)
MEPTVNGGSEAGLHGSPNTSPASPSSEDTDPLQTNVRTIRALSPEELVEFCRDSLPQDLMPSPEFMDGLVPSERTDALLACALVWTLSRGAEVPREFQLKAGLAALAGRDSVIRAGTGSGKTLAMAIPMLLRPNAMSIIISPLKRLQSSQVSFDATFTLT